MSPEHIISDKISWYRKKNPVRSVQHCLDERLKTGALKFLFFSKHYWNGQIRKMRRTGQGIHHHHHKHQGLEPLIRSVSRVTTVLANVSSVFQLFFFLVVCSDMISKRFGLVAFFASVKTSSVCIHLSCLVCIQSVVHGVRSRLFCGYKGCSLLEVSITSFLPLQFFVSVRLPEPNFLTHIKM